MSVRGNTNRANCTYASCRRPNPTLKHTKDRHSDAVYRHLIGEDHVEFLRQGQDGDEERPYKCHCGKIFHAKSTLACHFVKGCPTMDKAAAEHADDGYKMGLNDTRQGQRQQDEPLPETILISDDEEETEERSGYDGQIDGRADQIRDRWMTESNVKARFSSGAEALVRSKQADPTKESPTKKKLFQEKLVKGKLKQGLLPCKPQVYRKSDRDSKTLRAKTQNVEKLEAHLFGLDRKESFKEKEIEELKTCLFKAQQENEQLTARLRAAEEHDQLQGQALIQEEDHEEKTKALTEIRAQLSKGGVGA